MQWLTVDRFDSIGEINGTAAEHHPGGWGCCGQEREPHHCRHGQKGQHITILILLLTHMSAQFRKKIYFLYLELRQTLPRE